jgi:hypothetical protein
MPNLDFHASYERLKKMLFLERAFAAGWDPLAVSEDGAAMMPQRRSDNDIVGIGYRAYGDLLTIEVLTKAKVDPETVERYLMRCGLEGTRYKTVLTGRIFASRRPAHGGDSISQETFATGTLGCMVMTNSGERVGLSCCHVLNPTNAGRAGRTEIWQPGAAHGGRARDRIGVLAGFVPISFEDGSENTIDAAVFRPDDLSWVSDEIRDIGSIRGALNDPPFDCAVRKYGAESKLTVGRLYLKGVAMRKVSP